MDDKRMIAYHFIVNLKTNFRQAPLAQINQD